MTIAIQMGSPKSRALRTLTPEDRPVIDALLSTDDQMSEIAERYRAPYSRVLAIYYRLLEDGEPVPPRRPGRSRHYFSSTDEADTIGGRIAAMRLARGLSQRDLAARLKPPVAQPKIGKMEKAGDNVSPEMVARIAEALGCEPGELDGNLPAVNSVSLVRVIEPPGTLDGPPADVAARGPRWEPLGKEDRVKFDEIWWGDGPDSGELGALVDRAAEDGVAVVLRGDLPVRMTDDTTNQQETGR